MGPAVGHLRILEIKSARYQQVLITVFLFRLRMNPHSPNFPKLPVVDGSLRSAIKL
jgi:hypothetical protein